MLRKTAPASSMQKTYDECYLICSTAIYFEGQNNESEALRAWRNALDQIYYHNAYKMPSSYQPRSETEKALQDSLRSMELQCKERVDLLETLRKSRLEAEEEAKNGSAGTALSKSTESLASINKPNINGHATVWLGGDTVPQATYADLPRPSPAPEKRPAPPPRPSYTSTKSFADDSTRTMSMQDSTSPNLKPPTSSRPRSRTPSPEKKQGGMLRTLRSGPQKDKPTAKIPTTLRTRPPPAAAKAATQVWAGPHRPGLPSDIRSSSSVNVNTSAAPSWDPYTRSLVERQTGQPDRRISDNTVLRPPSPSDYVHPQRHSSESERLTQSRTYPPPYPEYPVSNPYARQAFSHSNDSLETAKPSPPPPMPPPHRPQPQSDSPTVSNKQPVPNISQIGTSSISYMKEFPNHPPVKPQPAVPEKKTDREAGTDDQPRLAPPKTVQAKTSPAVPRKAIGSRAVGVSSATVERQKLDSAQAKLNDRMRVNDRNDLNSIPEQSARKAAKRRTDKRPVVELATTPPSSEESLEDAPEEGNESTDRQEWDAKVKKIMKHLPKGVDETAAKQIFNEIVIQGDEVHWDDVAGLDIAKSALKETVVYPFLRPDLFMGLREPARGMLLFGPPGTGKTMLARAVATESKSVFFAISASSLTSKFLGESEKLVRALFAIAKALAPSIIFVDEIDSLLGSRGGSSEHEATRRIKTEFLIQWSDLQKAAAGREAKSGDEGDATRVLVLAATNTPWAIDEAARRRFVRRQYIPLPEAHVRLQQLRTLLAAQKHHLKERDLQVLVALTENYSGSDITALAKDAAMGPLRSLGEKLLFLKPEEIRGITMDDFEKSLVNIRPSVGAKGLKEFEDWAREFGERGG